MIATRHKETCVPSQPDGEERFPVLLTILICPVIKVVGAGQIIERLVIVALNSVK